LYVFHFRSQLFENYLSLKKKTTTFILILGQITTEILEAPEFYYAEDYNQQYLERHPTGYCGVGGTGVSCPIGMLIDCFNDWLID
jgi:peptide methionine sulfoxide reductase MsrA